MSPNETLAYQLLLNNVQWLSQSHGEPGFRALGFIPVKGLSEFARNKAVETAYNTFVNYDPRPRERVRDPFNEKGEYPPSLRLCYQHDLAYINVTPDFVRAVLVNYFTSVLPERGFPVTIVDDEELGGMLEVDEVALAKFAEECADHFIANAITVRCFLAEPDTYSLTEHGAHIGRSESSDRVETLADAVR